MPNALCSTHHACMFAMLFTTWSVNACGPEPLPAFANPPHLDAGRVVDHEDAGAAEPASTR